MEAIKIVVNSLEDANAGKPIVEGVKKDLSNVHQAKNVTFGLLEKGMQSGRTSLMIILENPDGTFSVGQMTQDHLEVLNAAVRGAVGRFGS